MIRYSLPEAAQVNLRIINVLGQTIKTLVRGKQQAGANMALWSGLDETGKKVPSGVYFYRLDVVAPGLTISKTYKMVLLQ